MNPYALSFVGTGGIVSTAVGIALAAPFSVGLWFKPPLTPAGGWLGSKNAGPGDGFRFALNSNGSVSLFWEGTSGTSSKTSAINLIKWNGWNFIGVAVDATNFYTYVNGKLESGAYTGTLNAATGLQIAKAYIGQFITGIVDKPFASSVALTQAQWDAIYHGNMAIPSSMVEWLLDDGSGTNAPDNSGNARPGTITNGTWVTDTPILGNTSSMLAMF